MLKLWGRRNSINVQKVLWTLGELGLAYQRVDAGMQFGVNDTPEYRVKNPNGLVPTLEDGELVTWESNSIVRYLAARYGKGRLWPEDAAARARSDRWMDWMQTTLNPALTPVFWQLIRTPPERRSQAEIDAGVRKLDQLWPIVEAALEERCIAGPELTIGDIPLGVCVYRWRGLPIERPSLPRLEAYYAHLSERPAFRTEVMQPIT